MLNALQYDVANHNDRISALERDMLEQKDMAKHTLPPSSYAILLLWLPD